MFIEQAIFTSVRSGRNEGYQLAAASPGVTMADKQELAQWGPGHDALYDPRGTAESINCHRMGSGCQCVSRTVLAGREYSGRGGYRVYTHFFLIPEPLSQRFSYHPFRIMEALIVSGRADVLKPVPDQLGTASLVGRSTTAKTAEIERLCQLLGPEKLAALLNAALRCETLGVSSPVPAHRLFAVLLDLLPPMHRRAFSWTTGLRVSPRRPYRLAALPNDRDEQRQAVRLMHLTVLDLHADPPNKFAARSGWPQLMYEFLRSRQFASLAHIVRDAAAICEPEIDLLAEQLRARLERQPQAVDLLTPFSPAARETGGTGRSLRATASTSPGGTARSAPAGCDAGSLRSSDR